MIVAGIHTRAATFALTAMVTLGGCGSGAGPRPTTPTAASGPSATSDASPEQRVTARISLPATTLRSGTSMTGRVTIDNDSGHAIQLTTCGSIYGVLMVGPRHHPTEKWTLCARLFTIPTGRSTYPVSVAASYDECSGPGGRGTPACLPDGSMPGLPAGRYEATTVGVADVVPLPAPVAILVTS